MRSVYVYRNSILAGTLTEVNKSQYVFRYDDKYFNDATSPVVSLTLPKSKQEYISDHLFPFFSNMLSEGANRKLQSRHLRIDENDDFGILMATAQVDTVGAITVRPLVST
ncbi:HipA N-terminal domain-containing protein [Candidatus Nomurabacteria bacterium]|nr:HipA N-terminal domain-containing protein [Candidatus Nomurabacteria bacterium]